MKTATVQELFKEKEAEAIRDFFTFLSFPSISTDAAYAGDVLNCANWLADYLRKIRFEVELWPTSGHPTLFASYTKAGPNKPTLLIYHHYDVQPVDPLEAWVSPPFDPTTRDGQIFARGAQDNKGQCFYTIQALKMLLERDGSLPINIKLCIEGEEECGSAGLSGILQQRASQLKADYLAIVDLGIPAPTQPAVTLGIRGLITMDVDVEGSYSDLHSGSHGGLVKNPIQGLIELLSKVKDGSGKVMIPGFYDDVQPLEEREKQHIDFTFDPKQYHETFGATPSGGEQAFSPLERVWTRPTFEINGISGGYTGSGFKTVIPAKANAKVSCRLVPNQDPKKIGKLVTDYLEKNAPAGIKVKVTLHRGGGKAVRANPSTKIVQTFSRAYEEVFNKPCSFIFEGGSIPIVTELAIVSGAEVVLVGLGLADDHVHAPNEHFGWDRIEQGVRIMARAIELLH